MIILVNLWWGYNHYLHAETNPFTLVPENSWQYDCIKKVCDMKADQPITRFVAAEMVYNTLIKGENTNKKDLEKLVDEFKSEINNIDNSLIILSDQVDSRIYMTGEVDLRAENYTVAGQYIGTTDGGGQNVSTVIPLSQYNQYNGSKLLRSDLFVNGYINEQWSYVANLRNDKYFGAYAKPQNSAYLPQNNYEIASGNNYCEFRQAYVSGNIGDLGVIVGMQPLQPAYGLILSDDALGASITGGDSEFNWLFFAGNYEILQNPIYWPAAAAAQEGELPGFQLTGNVSSLNLWSLSASASVSKDIGVKAAYIGMSVMPSNVCGDASVGQSNNIYNNGIFNGNYFVENMNFWELGLNWQIAPLWTMTTVYGQSTAQTQNSALRTQIDWGEVDINKPQTWHFWIAYSYCESLATIASNYNDFPACNNTVGNNLATFLGARGWELGGDYIIAPNIQLEFFANNYFNTNPSYSYIGLIGGQDDPGLITVDGINSNIIHCEADVFFYF